MNTIINFFNFFSQEEPTLIEIQGTISHTIENKFNFMFLGKLTKISDVCIDINKGQLHVKYW